MASPPLLANRGEGRSFVARGRRQRPSRPDVCYSGGKYFSALDELFEMGYVEHQFGLPANLEGFKRELRGLRTAFPDLHLTLDDLVERDDMVWIRLTANGTHTGPFMHRPPTGRPFSINVMDVVRLKNGKIVEHWGVPDRFALMWQLALLPQAQGQAA